MLNSVILMGRLVEAPEVRQTQSGSAVTRFSLAVSRDFARQGEDRQTDFFDIVAWGKTGEFASKYFRKGQQVCVRGRIETHTYDDRNGVRRKAYSIIAESLYFAEPKRDSYGQDDLPADDRLPQEPPQSFSNNGSNDFQEVTVDDDDLPF